MFFALIVLQCIILLALAVLLLRGRTAAPAAMDSRLEALLRADLPGQFARLDARAEAADRYGRGEMAQLREGVAQAAERAQNTAERQGEALRRELLAGLHGIGEAQRAALESLRGDHKADAERLRLALEAQWNGLQRRLLDFAADTGREQKEGRETVHLRLAELARAQSEHQEKLRTLVEARLDRLNDSNVAKLEEMRATVDEKLHTTLQSRLTESFGAVTDQLTKVHTGLGEMSRLSAGMDDLSRIFTNVKSRGGFAEVQLGMLLQQMLAPAQYLQNARVKANTGEMVEYAVKLPTPTGEVLLPIDAKFPREPWERLEGAYAEGTPAEITAAGKAFENAIRTEGRRICEKYIVPPATTNFGIMFLPTEGLYAEVMRRDGLQAEIQQNCRVTIAGPSTLSAILNSFQMGFHMLQLQQKGDEVWKVLAAARTQFGKFEDLMTRMDDQVSRVQKTIQEVGTRTRAINRTLREVSVDEESSRLGEGSGAENPAPEGLESFLPLLAAAKE